MWNFADLAKKAQELQDQAADAASSLSAPSTFFNLDAMRADTAATTDATGSSGSRSTAPPHTVPPQPMSPTSSSSLTVPRMPFSQPILPVSPPARTAPLGALKLPVSKNIAVPADATITTASHSNSNSTMSASSSLATDPSCSVVKDETTTAVHGTAAEPNTIARVEKRLAANHDSEPLEVFSAEHSAVTPTNDTCADFQFGEAAASTTVGQINHDTVATNSIDMNIRPLEPMIVLDTVQAAEAVADHVEPAPVPDNVSSESGEEIDSVDPPSDGECVVAAPDATDAPTTITTTETLVDLSPQKPTLDAAPSTPGAAGVHSNNTGVRGLSRRTKLVVLVSSSSINRQVKVRQDLVETALTAVGVEYESLDGALEEHKELRNELFDVSGLRAEYPQFFLVDLDHGGTVFWGGWEQFQHTNDDGKLLEAFGYHGPPVPQTPASFYESQVHITPEHAARSASSGSAQSVPDEILKNFSEQIKRIEENYQLERVETEQRHAEALRDASNHEQTRREMEERLMAELRTKEDQLQEVCRRNEGYRLKMDVLKREVKGTQELLQARDSDVGKANQKYLTDLRAMEKQLVTAEAKAEASNKDVEALQTTLETTRVELANSTQEHDELKQRVKTVAGELKDRRLECRRLQSRVDELTEQIRTMQGDMDSLQERLNHQGMSQTEKVGEMQQLQAKLVEADLTLKNAEKEWKSRELKSEQALVDYKKKAQNSLSMANSRTASAVQAREEAEMDARAARATADSAFDRATKAEIASREAVTAAKAAVKKQQDERDAAVGEFEKAQLELRDVETNLVKVKRTLEQAMTSKESKLAEIERLLSERATDQATIMSLQKQIAELTRLNKILRSDVDSLRDQLHHAKALVDDKPTKTIDNGKVPSSSINGHGDDTSVSTLRQELREANDAIEDLKAALASAVELNERKYQAIDDSDRIIDDSERSPAPVRTNAGSESIPLFYAMEKQAELKTARTEMNRLASVLADVQTEKTEAFEAMEAMKYRMEDAEARLKRFEKLSSATTGIVAAQNGEQPTLDDSGAVNIEYLKHIMLRFLNAKAITEKKALVPVIGAVLELTPNELQSVVQNVEHSAAGVGSTIFGFLS